MRIWAISRVRKDHIETFSQDVRMEWSICLEIDKIISLYLTKPDHDHKVDKKE